VLFFINRRQIFIEEGVKMYVCNAVKFVKRNIGQRLVIFKSKRPKFNPEIAILAALYSFIQILQFQK
jgi:hypothetical protein